MTADSTLRVESVFDILKRMNWSVHEKLTQDMSQATAFGQSVTHETAADPDQMEFADAADIDALMPDDVSGASGVSGMSDEFSDHTEDDSDVVPLPPGAFLSSPPIEDSAASTPLPAVAQTQPTDFQSAAEPPVTKSVAAAGAEDSREPEISESARQARKDHERAIRRVHRWVEKCRSALMSQQSPLTEKPSRAVNRAIRALSQVPAKDTDETAKRLRALGATRSPAAIDSLREFVDRKQSCIRVACAEALGQLSSPAATLTLLTMVEDTSADVKHAVIQALVAQESPTREVVGTILALGIVDTACMAIVNQEFAALEPEHREQFGQPLKTLLLSRDVEIVATALSLLTRIGNGQLIPVIARRLQHDAAAVRSAAVDALVQSGENRVVRFINQAMTDQDAEVRATAARALSRIHSPNSMTLLIAALSDAEVAVRRNAATTLSKLKSDRIAEAASDAIRTETDAQTIQSLLEALGKAGASEALKTLSGYLKSEDTDLRHRTIVTIRRIGDSSGAQLIAPLLDDARSDTRRMVVEAIGHLNDRQQVTRLRDVLKSDGDEHVRAAAARALGDLQDDKGVRLLEESLHDSRPVRCQAVMALGRIGKKTSLPALIAQLKDAAPEVRYHACMAIAAIGHLSSPEVIISLLNDKDAMVRRGAEATLAKLNVSFRKTRATGRLKQLVAGFTPRDLATSLPGGSVAVALGMVITCTSVFFGVTRFDQLFGGSSYPILNIQRIAVSPDGQSVCISRKMQVVEFWNVAEKNCQLRTQSTMNATGIVFAEDNVLLIGSGKVFEWNLGESQTEPQQARLPSLGTDTIALTPDASVAAFCSSNGRADLVNLKTRQVVGRPIRLRKFTRESSVALNADASLLITASVGGKIGVYSTETSDSLGELDLKGTVNESRFSVACLTMDSTSTYLALGMDDGKVFVLNVNDFKVVGRPHEAASGIIGMRFMNDSTALAVIDSKGTMAVCSEDFSSSKTLTATLKSRPEIVAFTPDGCRVAVAFNETRTFSVVDVAQDRVLLDHVGSEL